MPVDIAASILVLQSALHSLSDREAMAALRTDLQWKVACGLPIGHVPAGLGDAATNGVADQGPCLFTVGTDAGEAVPELAELADESGWEFGIGNGSMSRLRVSRIAGSGRGYRGRRLRAASPDRLG